MSVNEQLPMRRRYATAVILAGVCVSAYGISNGWFGSTTRSSEMESTEVSVSQSLDQPSGNQGLERPVDVVN